ncbi:tail assembly chaperone [Virgibacillus halodenitrificans]|uniref:tail assembly chaperone n=1 Tax=Virgibacillus halodenitrificans TaxID=1482 RepID=UPI001FB32D1E|nr:tail assembly chaperone [Virgibacillus halodenitrificans]MCJ0932921.1 tail assembly chaperone [Virgibacillus halodenitrificans]
MPILNIDGKDYEAKVTFKFNSLAKEKYYAEDKEGNKASGINNIYEKLLGYDHEGLLGFWDCAVNHYKERPKTHEIEDALMVVIEKEGDTEKLFKDCFKAMDQSGFFKLQAKKFWKDLENVPNFAEDQKEKKQMEVYVKQMKDNREELIKK